MTDPVEIRTPEDIMALARSFWPCRTLLTGLELGLFTLLGDKTLTSNELAGLAGSNPRATDRLLAALAGMGLVEKTADGFRNVELARRHLDEDGEAYLVMLGHFASLFGSWATLTDAVKAGTSVRVGDRTTKRTENFIRAMHYRAEHEARIIAKKLDLSRIRRVLDVGGGSGAMAMKLTEASPNLTVTHLDQPVVSEIARGYMEGHPQRDRIDQIEGDMREVSFGDNYDLILFMQIVHEWPPDVNRMLFAKATKALAPGGMIAVQDFILDPDRTTPPHASLFALNMLVNTTAGDTYTQADITGWMEEAGLGDVYRVETSDMHGMIVGTLK